MSGMRYVALLRGINVGGKTLIKMADLAECVAALGYDDVSTFIASGNVLLGTAERNAANDDGQRLSTGVAAHSGHDRHEHRQRRDAVDG